MSIVYGIEIYGNAHVSYLNKLMMLNNKNIANITKYYRSVSHSLSVGLLHYIMLYSFPICTKFIFWFCR